MVDCSALMCLYVGDDPVELIGFEHRGLAEGAVVEGTARGALIYPWTLSKLQARDVALVLYQIKHTYAYEQNNSFK